MCIRDRNEGETINNDLSPGTNSTARRSTTPAKNAITEYLFVENLSENMDSLPLQLNPWKRRARVSLSLIHI